MIFKWKRHRLDPDEYARAVIDALRQPHPGRPHFEDLSKPEVAEVIHQAVRRHVAQPTDRFEVLLDASGNWRLKPHRDEPQRVRVACYRLNESPADTEREAALNGELDGLLRKKD